jgi:hypothetical protein
LLNTLFILVKLKNPKHTSLQKTAVVVKINTEMKYIKSLRIGWIVVFIMSVSYLIWRSAQNQFEWSLIILPIGLLAIMPFKNLEDFNIFK